MKIAWHSSAWLMKVIDAVRNAKSTSEYPITGA